MLTPEVIITGIIGFIVLVAIVAGRTLEIENGRVVLRGHAEKKRRNPHLHCGHVKDVIQIFRNRDDMRDQIKCIELQYLPKEIMQNAEDAIERITSILIGNFLTLLKELKIAAKIDVANTPEFRFYTIILESIKPHLVYECRRMMHENGWIKKQSDGIFDQYVKTKTEDFITYFTSLLNDYYVLESPTRIQVYEWNKQRMGETRDIPNIIDSTVRSFLVSAINWQKEIDKLKTTMEAEMLTLLGED